MPLVPLATLLSATHGIYRHLGDEVTLLKENIIYIFEQHAAAEQSKEGFWGKIDQESVKEYFMVNYLTNIKSKLGESVQNLIRNESAILISMPNRFIQ